jgi:hypothetical protein
MNRDSLRQVVVALSTVLTLIVNGLANALPLNGQLTGEISDRFQVYFVPAGYVFSIWGLIYVLLVVYTVYQFLPAQRESLLLRRIGWLYVLSGLANSGWIFLWHYNVFVWTVPVMGLLLLLLVAIYLRIDADGGNLGSADWWAVKLAFSVYLGWITVATIANVTDLLYFLRWGGWGIAPQVWAVIMLVVAALITLAMILTRRDVPYALVIVWAFAGIAVKHWGTPLVGIAAAAAAAVVAIAALSALPRSGWLRGAAA